jgi:hypothetical protein
MGHGLKLTLGLALMALGQAAMAQPAAPAGSTVTAPEPVVVFDYLAQPQPAGLKIVDAAIRQLEREFGLRMQEMQTLAERINQGGPDAAKLKQDYDNRAQQLTNEISTRQKALLDPVIAKVQGSLPAFAAATGRQPVVMVGAQDIAGLAPGTVEDVSPAYVAWMNAQP